MVKTIPYVLIGNAPTTRVGRDDPRTNDQVGIYEQKDVFDTLR